MIPTTTDKEKGRKMIDVAKHIATVCKLRRIQPESTLEALVISRVKSSLLCAVFEQEKVATTNTIQGYPTEQYYNVVEMLEVKLTKIVESPEDTTLGLLTEYLNVKDTK